jgi:vacuolar iron transporter family protein
VLPLARSVMSGAAMSRKHHPEAHLSGRAAWLRAAVLGSDDAIVSTSSLMIGVAATGAPSQSVLLAGVAGLVAGSMSMAVGEYVSVSSQRDAEHADIAREKLELASEPHSELSELASIYERRGLDRELAMQVAVQLSAHDPLSAHMRDELGIEPDSLSQPLLAAVVSALSFGLFALLPIAALSIAPEVHRIAAMGVSSLGGLAVLGSLGAHLGGAPVLAAALRVTVGGSLAMAVTALVGRLFGVVAG